MIRRGRTIRIATVALGALIALSTGLADSASADWCTLESHTLYYGDWDIVTTPSVTHPCP